MDPIEQVPQPQADPFGDGALDSTLEAAFKTQNVPVEDSTPPEPSDIKPNDGVPDPQDSKPKDDITPKPVEKTTQPAPKAPAVKPGDPKDPSSIKQPANMSQKSAEGWKELHSTAKGNFELLKKTEAENKQLKTALAEKSTGTEARVKELETENEQLRGLREIVDLDNDPKFQKEYVEPVAKHESELVKIMKSAGISDEIIASHDFSKSADLARIYNALEKHQDSFVASRFKRTAEAYIEALDKKQEMIGKSKTNYKEFQESRKKEGQQKVLEESSRQQREQERIASIKINGTEDPAFPFLVRKEVPGDATPEITKQIEAHNTMVDRMEASLTNTLGAKTPEERVAVAVAAISSSYYSSLARYKDKVIEGLRSELKKVSKSGGERKVLGGGTPPKVDVFAQNASEALENAFPGMK